MSLSLYLTFNTIIYGSLVSIIIHCHALLTSLMKNVVVAGQLLLPQVSAGQLGSLQLPGGGQQAPEPVLLVPQQLCSLEQTAGSRGRHSQE